LNLNFKHFKFKIKKKNPELVVLAVGDGANDVNMITAADIGTYFFINILKNTINQIIL